MTSNTTWSALKTHLSDIIHTKQAVFMYPGYTQPIEHMCIYNPHITMKHEAVNLKECKKGYMRDIGRREGFSKLKNDLRNGSEYFKF